MKKTIYEGGADGNFYSFYRFRDFILGHGAEQIFCVEYVGRYGIYHLQDVTVAWIDMGYTSSIVGCGDKCRINLFGEESTVGEVERIILSQQEGLVFVKKKYPEKIIFDYPD